MSEGLIGHRLSADASSGILVEVNCESDFVARTDDFQRLIGQVIDAIEQAGDKATDQWLQDANGPVRQLVAAAIGKLGENMAVPRYTRFSGGGRVGQYIHLGGKLGVMVEFAGATPAAAAREEFSTLVKEIAMQIAAANPLYLTRAAVPVEVLEKEKDIYRGQMQGSGKPEAVLNKIIEGKLGSFYASTVLPDQESIRDPKQKVSEVIAAAGKALGSPISVTRFARLKVGEALS
jgi:elongation factor Ts